MCFLGIFNVKHLEEDNVSDEESEDEKNNIGELFKKVSKEQHKLKHNKDIMNLDETSLILPWNAPMKDWLEPQVIN